MRILAVDTATENCSAALLISEQLLTREQRLDRGHAEAILPMVDELLKEAGTPLAAFDAIAFGRGPGAFTGVRLAASVAQGLAFGAGVPVVPVSDLRALAQRAFDEERAVDRVLVCADARMHEVYWGCFERSAADLARAAGEEQVGKPALVRLPQPWSAPAGEAVWGAGSGFAAYPGLRAALGAQAAQVFADFLPRASEIARLAAAEVTAGRILPAEQALPVYLRDDVTHRGSR